VNSIPDRADYHHALEVEIDGVWILVDPTYDSALEGLGFKVNEWEGLTPTEWAENCTEVKLFSEESEFFDENFRVFLQKLDEAFRKDPKRVLAYADEFNEVLARFRISV